MSPVNVINMLTGDAVLQEGSYYVLSIYRPDLPNDAQTVWQAVDNDIYLRGYLPGARNQIWKCTLDSNNRWGFINVETGKRAGRNRYENVKCEDPPSETGSWQAFYFNRVSGGGYTASMTIYDKLCPLKITSDGGGQYFTLAQSSDLVTGVTKVNL